MIKTVYIVMHTHTDIGYTNIAPVVAGEHVLHLDNAISLCEKYRHNEPGNRFIWTVESFWTAMQYAKHRDIERLVALAKEGLIAFTGFTHQPLTQLCSLDELIAEFSCPRAFAAKYGLPVSSAMLNDIGGASGNLAQVMRNSGIKYFILGTGAWRVTTPIADLPHLSYYSSPDGSRVLLYHLGLGRNVNVKAIPSFIAQYGFGATYLLWPYGNRVTDGEKAVVEGEKDKPLLGLIKRVENDGYPYDALLIQLAMDNRGPQEDIVRVVEEWNETHDAVKLRISGPDEFFAHIERKYADALPVLQGELTCSWSEHVLTQGVGQAALQRARVMTMTNDALFCSLSAAERAALSYYPAARKRIVNNTLLFNDHTFGLTMWGWQKKRDESARPHLSGACVAYAERTWELKRDYAETARRESDAVCDAITTALISSSRSERALSVFNPLPHNYRGLVSCFIRNARKDIAVSDGNAAVNADREDLNSTFSRYTFPVAIAAGEMKAYGIIPAQKVSSSIPVRETGRSIDIRAEGIAISVDKKSGLVTSLSFDGVEYADGGLNDIVFHTVSGVCPDAIYLGLCDGATFSRVPSKTEAVRITARGEHRVSISILRSISGAICATIETEISVDLCGRKALFRNRIRQIHTETNHAIHAIFPFAMSAWKLHAMQQGYWLRFPEGVARGGALTNIGFQNGAYLTDGKKGVLVTSHQAMILSMGGPKYYDGVFEYPRGEKAHLYCYCANNLWNTNCALRQYGDLCYDFTVEPFAPDADPGECAASVRANLTPPVAFADVRREWPGIIAINDPAFDVRCVSVREDGIRVAVVNTSRKERATTVTIRGGVEGHSMSNAGSTAMPLTLASGKYIEFDIRCNPAQK